MCQQVTVIPMRSDLVPFMVNLFPFHYKDKWIRFLIQARKFCDNFQFIDNLTAIIGGGEFEKIYHEIYPPELELKHETVQIKKHLIWILT